MVNHPYRDSRPYVRWWWFSGPIAEQEIRCQLEWVARQGFGGVEVAWVYPQPGAPPGPRFLSAEWSALVASAKRHAEALGLGCDFTFGTLWPFGGSMVSEHDASQTLAGPSPQRLDRSWEIAHGPPGRVLNHLDRRALERYAAVVGKALRDALKGSPSALFCDSWEVEGDVLWSSGFGDAFRARYGYSLEPFAAQLNRHPSRRYDYRRLLADTVLEEFYRPFTALCHQFGAWSRVQCHGSPTDLLAAYAACDIPESETVLFDPPFSRFAASAAALAGRPVVSAEAFTCLYGWRPYPGPGPYHGQERLGDLKLVADALFANGVNMIVWHGMPYNPPGGANRFYATVHVGPDCAFAGQLASFNSYLTEMSQRLRQGQPDFDLAVYLPLEDNWMRGELPPARRRPSARFHWELQYVRLPSVVWGYRPLWVSEPFLASAQFDGRRLYLGDAAVRALYVDVRWMDAAALSAILRLAQAGLPICLRRLPRQPGSASSPSYQADLARLVAQPNVVSTLSGLPLGAPFLEGESRLEYWCRRDQGTWQLFLAHPATRRVRYPLRYGQGETMRPRRWSGRLNIANRSFDLRLAFGVGQSLWLEVDRRGSLAIQPVGLPEHEFEPPRELSSAQAGRYHRGRSSRG